MPPTQTASSPISDHVEKPLQIATASSPSASAGAATGRKITGVAWFVVNVALLSATFLYTFDNTVTATVRPAIVDTFGNRIDMLPWVSVAYPMGEVGTDPIWAKLNKFLDGKLVFLAALIIFEVGSAVIGSASSIGAVVAGRALAGSGGSGIYVGTISMITGMTTAKEQNQYLNIVDMAWSLGTILGPVIGSAFADSPATWRWAFYINICVAAVAAVAAPACIWIMPSAPPSVSLGAMDVIRAFDHLGAVLILGSAVSTVMLLGFGGVVYSWDSGQMIGLYVAIAILWIMFALQQKFHLFTSDRIFPVQYFKDPLVVGLWIWTIVAISEIVFVLHDSSMRSAVYTLPFVASIVVSAGISGGVMPKFPWYKCWFIWASVLLLVSNGLLSSIHTNTSRATICGYTVIQGFGVGPVIQLGYTVGQLKRPQAARKDVTAFFSCAQMGGLALSLGIATSVLINHATEKISHILPNVPISEIRGAIDGVGSSLLATLSEHVRAQVTNAVTQSVASVFYLNIFGAAPGFFIALPLKFEKWHFAALQ
ncbi:efflux pump antibiotic resistance protein [Aspergillus eucalypticola CBS 122712]|uniref:Efflux pump antibiotic resistance protein n=1 Tax=Aspergillus eucalypticola (strain CBS 122712 / IBT 29274) TaxID=1448314 RepID=A0A317W0P9_ASPEC|nr:efflux pump antibiotic resistance protein [Aspergillus eucalypticola CBS 122712]PWY78777.1 efflux pump antibiotic resistance protein [Aspergillus eucalypticola CBS 122712]